MERTLMKKILENTSIKELWQEIKGLEQFFFFNNINI